MMGKGRPYFLMAALAMIFLSMPIMVGASPLSWTSRYYSLTSVVFPTGEDISYVDFEDGPYPYIQPPLQTNVSAWLCGFTACNSTDPGAYGGDASTLLTDSSLSVLVNTGGSVNAFAASDGIFNGSFTASDPTLNFSYDYSSLGDSSFASSYFVNEGIRITIKDVTDSTQLYSTILDYSYLSTNHSGSDMISVATPIGHDINVTFSMNFGAKGFNNENVVMNYSMDGSSTPVVPEPISSILFVAGGTLLLGRNLLRKKA